MKKRPKNWSKLDTDLLRPILESLSSKDFHKAKSTCSDWYTVSTTCVRGFLCPWRITYQGSASMLFDPEEISVRKLDFVLESFCMASSGNWVLLVDPCLNFCIVHLVTCERINLPSTVPSARTRKLKNDVIGCKNSAVLSVNEKTGDYVVFWIFKQHQLFSIKKGDRSWRKWDRRVVNSGVFDMAYNNSKLYLYTLDHHIKILDFSGRSPKIQGIKQNPYLNYPFRFVESSGEYIWKRRIAIRDSGEVLIILSLKAIHEEKTLFYVFKMNLESKKWERVDSIGDNEMLIFGHGVTIRVPVQNAGDGFKSDSICFVDEDVWPDSDHPSNCGVFDLATSKITWPKRFGFGGYIDKTQWFVPVYGDGIKSDSMCFVDEDVSPDPDHPLNCGVFDLVASKITWPRRFGFGFFLEFGNGEEADDVQVLPLVSTFWRILLFMFIVAVVVLI